MKEVYIVSAVRTPIGSFMGSLSSIPATDLGAIAIKGAIEKIGLSPDFVEEVYMGNVFQAGEGQAPAKQAALKAGLSTSTPCTTVNKVCASGMKSIMLGAQSIMLGDANIVVAGGMESMSQVPHYVYAREATKLGDTKMKDGMLNDGLLDAYSGNHMGYFAELCAKEKNITREAQDAFAIESYKRSQSAVEQGKFKEEIIPVSIPQRKGEPLIVTEDEEYKKVNFDKIATLRPAFVKEGGTVTAANASTINDGAAAVVLMSKEKMEESALKPLAKIVSYADASEAPEWFTIAPAVALPKALHKAGLAIDEVDYFEFNEAFSVVGIVNTQILGLDKTKVNVNGGAVSLGHPLGCSGARIVVTLAQVLKQNNARYGAAAICNGGGGASAIVIENIATH